MSFWKSDSSARDALAQVAAIGRSQAVIEFKLDGTIITANQNFLDAMGYRLDEIAGQAPQMFVPPEQRGSAAYGVLGAAQPRRISGRRIQADRQGRPRGLDPGVLQSDHRQAGKPMKVVKFATDITAQQDPQHGGCRQDFRHRPRPGGDRVQSRRHHHHRQREFPGHAGLSAGRDPGPASQHVRGGRPSATAPPTANSGPSSAAANSSRPSTSASARAARRSGFSLPTIRSSTRPASRSRW